MAGEINNLSFKDWCRVNRSIPPNQKQTRYRDYLKNNTIGVLRSQNEDSKNEIREFYINFLRRLVLLIDDEETNQLKLVNFDDDNQLISAIPLFSKKIKELSDIMRTEKTVIRKRKQFYASKGSLFGLNSQIESTLNESVNFVCKEKWNITC